MKKLQVIVLVIVMGCIIPIGAMNRINKVLRRSDAKATLGKGAKKNYFSKIPVQYFNMYEKMNNNKAIGELPKNQTPIKNYEQDTTTEADYKEIKPQQKGSFARLKFKEQKGSFSPLKLQPHQQGGRDYSNLKLQENPLSGLMGPLFIRNNNNRDREEIPYNETHTKNSGWKKGGLLAGLFAWMVGSDEKTPVEYDEVELTGMKERLIEILTSKDFLGDGEPLKEEEREKLERLFTPNAIMQCQNAATVSPQCQLLISSFAGPSLEEKNGKAFSFVQNVEQALLKATPHILPFTTQDIQDLYGLDNVKPLYGNQEINIAKANLNISLCLTNLYNFDAFINVTKVHQTKKAQLLKESRAQMSRLKMNLPKNYHHKALAQKLDKVIKNLDDQIESLKNQIILWN